MKRILLSGLIAGLVFGAVKFIFDISGLYESFSSLPHTFPFPMQSMVLHSIILGMIWGVIWTAIYVLFINYIPAKGIMKGLIYGLIIWTIAILRPTVILFAYGYYNWAIPVSIASFFSICMAYGLVIGILYKKD